MSGVRSGSSTTSTVIPAMSLLRHQPATRSTARFMWPLAAQSASKAGERAGMAMYSWRVGTMSPDQTVPTSPRSLVVSTSDPHRDEAVDGGVGLGHHPGDEVAGVLELADRTHALAAGVELAAHVDGGPVREAEVVGALLGRVHRLLGEGLELLGVVVEVLRPVVANDPAGLAGVRPCDDGAVLGGGKQRVLVAGNGPGFVGGDEPGADPDAVGAEGERGGEAAPVEESAGRHDGNLCADRVDDLRHERDGRHLAGVPAGLRSLGDDEVAAGR